MAKASTTKASPVKVSFDFDCELFFALTNTRNTKTAELIRLVHETIKPGVTHAAIAEQLENFSPIMAASNNVRMVVGHYAQTAALALSDPAAPTEHYTDDDSLSALYRIRTTGTASSRKAMVAAYDGTVDFVEHVNAWAKATRAAKTAAASASDDKSTAKVSPKGETAAPAAPVALPADSFAAILKSLDVILAAETDAKVNAEFAKALQLRVNRAKARTIAPKPAKVAA